MLLPENQACVRCKFEAWSVLMPTRINSLFVFIVAEPQAAYSLQLSQNKTSKKLKCRMAQ